MYLNPAGAAAALVALNATNPSGIDPYPQQAIICWDDRYATKILSYPDCENVVSARIATGPDPSTPIYFSRNPIPPFVTNRVPKFWQAPPGICKVGIDVPSAGAEQTSLLEIQAAARAILMSCVLGAAHLGGTTLIGSRGDMLVEILG
ncbi:MAG: hypothetical protein Q9216_006843 [Gyalolechia sp. 2 TL-2023]